MYEEEVLAFWYLIYYFFLDSKFSYIFLPTNQHNTF